MDSVIFQYFTDYTNADGCRGSIAISRVCPSLILCVCVFVAAVYSKGQKVKVRVGLGL